MTPRRLPALALLLLVPACGGGDSLPSNPAAGADAGPFEPAADRRATVERVLDGEALVLAGGQRVRLLGVDAPEGDAACADESAAYLEELVEGREVEVDVCEMPPAGEPLAEGELSGYVAVPGESFVNLEMLRAGLAQFRGTVGACGGGAAEGRLAGAQSEAMDGGRGMFGSGGCGSEAPTPTPEPPAEPQPTPVVMERPAPGSDADRAEVEIVGLGNPPPEPPIRGDGIWVEAIVRNVSPGFVEFYIDDRPVRTDRGWPYTLGGDRFDTRTVSDGFHTATARVVFPDGSVLVAHQPMWVENE